MVGRRAKEAERGKAEETRPPEGGAHRQDASMWSANSTNMVDALRAMRAAFSIRVTQAHRPLAVVETPAATKERRKRRRIRGVRLLDPALKAVPRAVAPEGAKALGAARARVKDEGLLNRRSLPLFVC